MQATMRTIKLRRLFIGIPLNRKRPVPVSNEYNPMQIFELRDSTVVSEKLGRGGSSGGTSLGAYHLPSG